jgi:hypothetical protein
MFLQTVWTLGLKTGRGNCSLVSLFIYLLTYSMKQSPSCKAKRLSASQEISPHFTEPEGSLSHSYEPATCPYPEPDRSSP